MALLILAGGAFAGNPPASGSLAGPIIDSVVINAENVYDLDDPRYDNFLFRMADKLHFVTRDAVIKRELLLDKGDRYDTSLVNESIRNLRRLDFLLKTDIRLEKGPHNENIMVVNTSDKWTTSGGASFHRTGGRNDMQFGLQERNLYGYGIYFSNNFFIPEKDRNYYQMELSDNRFLGKNVLVDLFYSDDPRAGSVALLLERPYYNLSQKWGAAIDYVNLRRRRDYYISEVLVGQERSLKNTLQTQISYRDGPNNLKYQFTQVYQYIDLSSRGMNLYDSAAQPFLPPPTEDSLVNYFQLTARLQQIRYTAFERLNRFYKPEDINLGLDFQISYGRAFRQGLRVIIYHYLAVWPQYTLAFGSNLLFAGFQHEEWYSGGQTIRKALNYYFKGYRQYHRNYTVALGARLSLNHLIDRSYTLYLDEESGVRGYPIYFLNGEDRLIINIENRFYSDLEILSVGVGGAVFADIGNIWSRGESPALVKSIYSFGAGLRFGVSRSSHGEVVRIDFAYAPKRKSWQVSIGTGQFF